MSDAVPEVASAWLSLPRRIYPDTSTLQKLYDFGGEIFEKRALRAGRSSSEGGGTRR